MRARIIYLFSALLCAALLIAAYMLEHFFQVVPCPLCLLQRFVYEFLLIIFIIAAIQNPTSIGLKIYAAFSGLVALLGVGLSARQVYLQLSPAGKTDVCLPGLSYMLKTMPLTKVIATTLKGSSECATTGWSFLGLSLAAWSLLGFVFFVGVACYQWFFANGVESTRHIG